MRRNLLIGIVATAFFSLSGLSNIYAYNSHTFENTEYLNDRPYIAGLASPAYVCIRSPIFKNSVAKTKNVSGDAEVTTTTYSASVPELDELIGTNWYWASRDGSYNEKGNPCKNGTTSLWFSDVILGVPKNSPKTVFKMQVQIRIPDRTVTTITTHKRFLLSAKVKSETTTYTGSVLFSSLLVVYRSDSDARQALIGSDASFFADSTRYQNRQQMYSDWFG